MLGYLEVFGVVIGSGIERHVAGETTRKESWLSYGVLCLCLLVSSATSNIALAYINYPTKVVFRSCKLIPTMLIAVFVNRKHIPWYEFMFGGFISLGMVFFAAADFTVYPNFDFIGKLLIYFITIFQFISPTGDLLHLLHLLCSFRDSPSMYQCGR